MSVANRKVGVYEKTMIIRGSALVVWVIALLTLIGLAVTNPDRALLIGVVLGALMVLLVPVFFLKTYDIFQPLSFVIFSVLLGVTGRTLYVTFSSSDGAAQLLLGEPPEFLLPAAFAILVGLVCFVAGYLSPFPRLPLGKFKIAKSDNWNSNRLLAIVALYTLISVVATMVFLRETGFSFHDLVGISSKRFVRLEEAGLVDYAALGYLRWGASLSQLAFLLILAWFARSKRGWTSLAGLAVLLMFGVAAFFPFVTSSRGSLLWLVLSGVIVWHYLRKPVSMQAVLVIAMLALVTLSVMLSFRQGAENPWEALSPGSVVGSVLGSRDFLDITTTAFIIDALQERRLEPSYGSTYFTWLFAPIPRKIWPEKPIISVGLEVKSKALGLGARSGTPPGIIGEAYWAFGIAGVMVIPFFIGGLMGLFYRSFRPYLTPNANMAIVYAAVIVPLSFKVVGSNWSGVVISLLQDLLPLAFALYFVTRPPLRWKQTAKELLSRA